MKKIILFLTLLIALYAFCNEAPIVENVLVQQRDDGSYIVDIYYDLEDQDGDAMNVSVYASNNEGETWGYLITALEGDIGNDIVSGTNKHIIWDFAADHPGVLNIPTMIKVVADDRNVEIIDGMVFVQGGTFEMGDHYDDGEPNELPIHTVTVSSFYMALYEVTQAEYEAVTGNNPVIGYGYGIGDNYPVYNVDWYDAVTFCNLLSQQEGLTPCYDLYNWTCNFEADGYRLPTEAEWEYAAMGGIFWTDNFKFSGTTLDIENFAWLDSNSGDQTHEVGSKMPNQLGIYDLSGNVWEWCYDWMSEEYYLECDQQGIVIDPLGPEFGSQRIRRGGCWDNLSTNLRNANRSCDPPDTESSHRSFRVVRSIP